MDMSTASEIAFSGLEGHASIDVLESFAVAVERKLERVVVTDG